MANNFRLTPSTYSDVAYVEGSYKRVHVIERALYNHCKRYFDLNYRGVFFVGDEMKDEIFQEAFIALWESISSRKIYVEDGILKGKDGKPFKSRLTTYFMSIAKNINMEYVRDNNHNLQLGFDNREDRKVLMELFDYVPDDEIQYEIMKYCISYMPKGCNRILTLYYYEGKDLDSIMLEMSTYASKNALKTAKYKCIENLKKTALAIYNRYLNA